TTSTVFVPRSLPLVTRYVQRSPGRQSGGDETETRRSAGTDSAGGSEVRFASGVRHAALDSTRTERATRNSASDTAITKSSHRWRDRGRESSRRLSLSLSLSLGVARNIMASSA